MLKRIIVVLVFIVTSASSTTFAVAKVSVIGTGTTKDEAILAALRSATEKAFGVCVISRVLDSTSLGNPNNAVERVAKICATPRRC
jgi:hypothetical protein